MQTQIQQQKKKKKNLSLVIKYILLHALVQTALVWWGRSSSCSHVW